MNDLFIDNIKSMMHSPIHNYIVPGLSSWKIGEPSEKGMVRLFTCSRDHHENIVPHSHRYNFQCLVLQGYVDNFEWEENPSGDLYLLSEQKYIDEIGKYETNEIISKYFISIRSRYHVSDTYGLKHNQIHSITFSKDSMVLFFESETKSNTSMYIEPIVNGKVIPVFQTEPWMFCD